MNKNQALLVLFFPVIALMFSACCGAQCRLNRQDIENQYLITAGTGETTDAARKMLDNEGYRPYVENKGDGITLITGKLSADRPGNEFVSANLRFAIKKSAKQDIKRADLTKTIVIKGRWDAAGEKLLENETGIITTLEFTARDVSGTVVDSWVKNNEEPERSLIGKKLQKLIDRLRKAKEEETKKPLKNE